MTDSDWAQVGPYMIYGALLVKACAENGVHYLDLTGKLKVPVRRCVPRVQARVSWSLTSFLDGMS